MRSFREPGLSAMSAAFAAAVLSAHSPWVNAQSQPQGQSMALEEIIVTAQKREQSIQDVPIAVTALGRDTLEVNRVFSVEDLNGLAPNALVRPTSGASNIPEFTIRGRSSTGLVAGADKQVAIYLDNVYIGSARGTMFQLPDIARIEVLRGPQGTLFGRSATAGAISITTREPVGEFGFTQDLSFGNSEYFRSRTSIDSPAWGPLSAYLSYVVEEREGDIRNLAPNVKWDRTAFNEGIDSSVDTFGDKDTESLFFAVAFEPNESLKATYKYDWSEDSGTPDAHVPGAVTPQLDALWSRAVNAEQILSTVTFPGISRPDAVADAYSIRREQEVFGHNLTIDWEINDSLSLKNVTAYREALVWQPSDLTGFSAVELGGGILLCLVCSNAYNDTDQFSNELQFNYDGDWLTLTAGALYYEQQDEVGPSNTAGTVSNQLFFPGENGYIVNAGNEVRDFVDTKSYAAYAQVEAPITDQLQFLLGYRLTRDERDLLHRRGTRPDFEDETFEYKGTDSTYLAGLNYAFSEDILVYGKFSTGYVPGGKIGPQAFDKEEAKSFELGMKADFLNGRLRSNLALFDVTYKDPQNAGSGAVSANTIEEYDPELAAEYRKYGTLIQPIGGDLEVSGAELELTALPLDGLTLGASLGYQDAEYTSFNFLAGASAGIPQYGGTYLPTRVPKWNGNLSLTYESTPVFENAYLFFNITGIWRDETRFEINPARENALPEYQLLGVLDPAWMVNARAALKQVQFGDFVGEVAVWAKNLTDEDDPYYALNLTVEVIANYPSERTVGVEFSVKY